MKQNLKKIVSLLSLGVLIAAVFCLMGCKEETTSSEQVSESEVVASVETIAESVTESAVESEAEATTDASEQESATDGEAVTHTFTFKMKDGETEKEYTIETTETIVGAALLKEGLIEGAVEQYGLYVKTVCGIKHDYAEDGKYWAFYVGDDYAIAGVDSTEIVDGTVYWLKAE